MLFAFDEPKRQANLAKHGFDLAEFDVAFGFDRFLNIAARAFSSEVDAGSREENATTQQDRAFSSEVDAGSREENATTQQDRAFSVIQRSWKML